MTYLANRGRTDERGDIAEMPRCFEKVQIIGQRRPRDVVT